jgi:hypothetical protein
MINLFQAEWQKAVGNRWVTGFLVWIFPVGMLSFIVFSSIAMLLSSSFREGFAQGITSWTDSMVNVWAFVTNPFGRMFLIGFMAVTFAGEYQWQTWKNIVPRSGRASLILMKFVVVTLIFLLTFILVSIILGVGQGIQAQIADVPYGPAFSLDVGLDFLQNYLLQMGLTTLSVMISGIIAVLAAMMMRSILGGALVGIGIAIVEPVSLGVFIGLAGLFDSVFFLNLYRFTPFYNIENISSWIRYDSGTIYLSFPFEYLEAVAPIDSILFSTTVLLAWVIGGIGLILYLFNRQDITS